MWCRRSASIQRFSRRGRRETAPEIFEILCVGRLAPAKGQHILIDALEKLTQEGRQVRLRLVGSGPDDASLLAHAARSTAGEWVVFEGAINQDRIRDFYAAADAFCLPSLPRACPWC